jgi:hypothetical protein
MGTRFTFKDNILQADASGVYQVVDGQSIIVGSSGEMVLSSTSGIGSIDGTGDLLIGFTGYTTVNICGAATGLSFHGATPTVQQTAPAAATGTYDAAIVNALRTIIINLGLAKTP